MFFIGWAKHPLRLIVSLAIAVGLARGVLAPAHVSPVGQLVATFGFTYLVNVVWTVIRNIDWGDQDYNSRL